MKQPISAPDDIRSDSELARELVPGKFKFTSQQGRARRMQLLTAAKEMLCERKPEDVSFADVCHRAGIPRASAYHFFPNIHSIFLGLRFLHAQATVAAVLEVDVAGTDSWHRLFFRLVDAGVEAMRADPAATKLIYGSLGGMIESQQLGRALDARLALITLAAMARRFQLPVWPERERVVAVAFTILDSIIRLSYRLHGEVTEWMVDEAKRASVSYLRNYLPEFLPPAS